MRPPPPGGPKFFQSHADFWKFSVKSYVGAPSAGELAPPPRGNPGSATDLLRVVNQILNSLFLIQRIQIKFTQKENLLFYTVADPGFPKRGWVGANP